MPLMKWICHLQLLLDSYLLLCMIYSENCFLCFSWYHLQSCIISQGFVKCEANFCDFQPQTTAAFHHKLFLANCFQSPFSYILMTVFECVQSDILQVFKLHVKWEYSTKTYSKETLVRGNCLVSGDLFCYLAVVLHELYYGSYLRCRILDRDDSHDIGCIFCIRI